MLKKIELKPIGIIRSGFKNPHDEYQHRLYETISEATIEIFSEYKDGLLNLDNYYNAIFVIYLMHKITDEQRQILKRRPLDNSNLPLVGVFAGGAPARPNPIGITPCELLKVEDNKIYVRGLDAIDGSPLLDIKPYYSSNYVITGTTCPEWIKAHHENNDVKARLESGD